MTKEKFWEIKNKIIALASSNEDFSREQNYLLNQDFSNISFEEWEDIISYCKEKNVFSNNEILALSTRKYITDNPITTASLSNLYTYSKYVPLEEIVPKHILEFINFCGIDNLIKFNDKFNQILDRSVSFCTPFEGVLNTLLCDLAGCFEKIDKNFKIESYDDCVDLLNRLMEINKVEYVSTDPVLSYDFFQKNKELLREAFPKQFLDYKTLYLCLSNENKDIADEIVRGLEDGLLGNTYRLPIILNYNKDLVDVFKDVNILFSDDSKEYKLLYDSLGHDEFLDICAKYGNAINKLVKHKEKLKDLLRYSNHYELRLSNDIYELLCWYPGEIYRRNFPQEFKEKYPELFISEDAPEELKELFYGEFINLLLEYKDSNSFIITFNFGNQFKNMYQRYEWIPYLEHIDLRICCKKIRYSVGAFNDFNNWMLDGGFTTKEILTLCADYGVRLRNIIISNIFNSKAEQYDYILNQIYKFIVANPADFYLAEKFPKEFMDRYPDLFISDDVTIDLYRAFYKRNISAAYIKDHPEYKKYLVEKNLVVCSSNRIREFVNSSIFTSSLTNKEILDLFEIYGKYLDICLYTFFFPPEGLSGIEEAIDEIDRHLINRIADGKIHYEEDLKEHLYDKCPDIFLEDDAPLTLKEVFYSKESPLTFKLLREHPEWEEHLKDKDILTALLRTDSIVFNDSLIRFFDLCGKEKAIKIGKSNPDIVEDILRGGLYLELFNWYNKCHFVPHCAVIINFPEEEIDKFVAAGKKWSVIMQGINHTEEVVSAALKASICFGVFDKDDKGFSKVMELVYGLPPYIYRNEYENVEEYLRDSLDSDDVTKALKLLKKSYNYSTGELIKDTKEYNSKHYRLLRKAMEDVGVSNVFTEDKLHKVFGGFRANYNPDFRDFFLDNLIEITACGCLGSISSIEKQWSKIKSLNSNRVLTLDLAMDYIQSNVYDDLAPGNEKLASISNKVGYDNEDFTVLQAIYNYGKLRTFSSIPRVESTYGRYRYEILRLDDPLALAIGTLTDCCQELNDNAELSMEHSMVSPHGRVFVVFDEEDNIVAQSWVWRNQNVLCFDNIEIPDKAFIRAKGSYDSREGFVDEIYKLYEKASKELMEKDNNAYKTLLSNGLIIEDDYNDLKLSAITIGEGYNDIADSLKRNAKLVKYARRPLPFEAPIPLNMDLYTDSDSQFITVGEEKTDCSIKDTLTIYQDEFRVLDKDNIEKVDKILLQMLAVKMGSDWEEFIPNYDQEDYFFNLAYNYDIYPDNAKIIMNANFAIIYEIDNNNTNLVDILYNTDINLGNSNIDIENIVAMQIRMGLEQISQNRKLDITELENKSLDIYNKAMKLDVERGINKNKHL